MSDTDPGDFSEMTKEDLVELIANTNHDVEHLQAMVSEAKNYLTDQIKGSGEIIGEYSVVKAKRLNWKVKLEEARELGAVKDAVDSQALKKLHNEGVKLPHSVTEYLLIKRVEPREKVVKDD